MAVAAPDTLLHKNLTIELDELDEEQGIVGAYVSGIGNKDSVGDIIQPGAFDNFLKIRKPKGVWSHDWDRPVSKTLEIYEVPAGDARLPMKMQLAGIGGLYVKTQFNLGTKEGRDAFENVKFFGDEAEWSIGYQVHDQEYDKTQKANLLKTIELYEYSPVLFGANSLTSTVSIKAERTASGELDCKIEGLDEVQTKAVKAALEVVLKEASVEDDSSSEAVSDDEAEEADMSAKTETFEVELEDGSVKTFRSEEKRDAFLTACGEYADAVKSAADAVDGEKAVAGSFEERSEKIRQALREAAGKGASVWPVATFDSSVVYELYDYDTGNFGYFQCEYSVEDGEIKLGEATEVELVEVVLAKAALADAIKADMLDELKAMLDDEEFAPFAAKALVEKAGRVLSKTNRSALEKAAEAIQAVLDADAVETIEETEEKTVQEKALDAIDEQVKSGSISEETADLLKSAIEVPGAEVEEVPEELKGLSDEDLEGVKAWAEAVELAPLADLSEDDIKAIQDWQEALVEGGSEAEEKSADESEEDLTELEGLSDEDLEAIKELAEALAEKVEEDESEDEKSTEAVLAADLKELADISSYLDD